jgi:hypothetical protein
MTGHGDVPLQFDRGFHQKRPPPDSRATVSNAHEFVYFACEIKKPKFHTCTTLHVHHYIYKAEQALLPMSSYSGEIQLFEMAEHSTLKYIAPFHVSTAPSRRDTYLLGHHPSKQLPMFLSKKG